MNRLEKKTKTWADRNIISMAQREQILEQEHIARAPFIFFSFVWLGVFLVALGCGSLVVAYWPIIPEMVKLSVVAILLIGSFVLAYYGVKREYKKLTEIALVIAFFMIGGGIGLVAQIFNLPVGGIRGLFLWLIFSFGIVMLSHQKWLAFLWIPLFFGGVLGYMRLELLLLFFEQSPLFATTLFAGILICLIYLSHFFTDKLALSLYHWSIILYFPIVFLGDMAMTSAFRGFLLSLMFLVLLLFFAVTARRQLLFNITGFFIVGRILLFYFQSMYDLIHAGIGFLSAGVILLLVVGGWVYFKKIKKKKRKIDNQTAE